MEYLPALSLAAASSTLAYWPLMASPSSLSPTDPVALQDRIDDVLRAFLSARRQELEWLDPRATGPIDEVIGLFEAGGKRIRPAFCYWGFRAAGGPHGEAILRAAASLELLHTMALIHDDVMGASPPAHRARAPDRGRGEPRSSGAGADRDRDRDPRRGPRVGARRPAAAGV